MPYAPHALVRHSPICFARADISSAGYPLISHFTEKPMSTNGGFNLGGINATGQVSSLCLASSQRN